MRITQSEVALSSQRSASVSDVTRSTMQAWIGDRPSRAPTTRVEQGIHSTPAAIAGFSAQAVAVAARRAAARDQQPRVQLPQLATAVSTSSTVSGPDASDPTITDPNLAILIQLIEKLTGHKIHLVKPGDVPTNADAAARQAGNNAAAAADAQVAAQNAPAQPQPAGWGVEIHVQQVHHETETTAYRATGQVVTADGQAVSFDFQLGMHRDLTQQVNIDVLAGDAIKKVDPIALNLNGGPVALSETRTAFDINSDGTAEKVALPAAGTYFLALDRNGNGTVDNGTELFGPATGSGFGELKTLDGDGNGWIDESDAAYASLRLWSGPDGATKSLAEAGVGALYVGQSVSTQFDIRSGANETLGQVVSSSVYLGENGKPGALQQVDLTA
jgi:hypothetical protein